MKLFEEISAGEDKVILDYERAIIYDHKGQTVRCEEPLFRAMELNSQDLLCHIGLVYLYTETGQVNKPLVVIKRMKE